MKELRQHFLLKVSPTLMPGGKQVHLGRVIERLPGGDGFTIKIKEETIESLLECMGLKNSKSLATPGVKADAKTENEEPLELDQARTFRTGTGKLLFISSERCDLQYSTKEVARGMSRPTVEDFGRLKKVCRYLLGTKEMKSLLRPRKELGLRLTDNVDSDWAGDKISRKSTSSCHLFLAGALVHAHSRTQGTAALSSPEAEIYAMGSGACEGLLVKSFLEELLPGTTVPLELLSDSSAGLSSQNRLGLGKLKHVHLKFMFLQGLLREGRLQTSKVWGTENSSDLGTKYLDRGEFEKHRAAAGLVGSVSENSGGIDTVEAMTKSSGRGMGQIKTGIAQCSTGILLLIQGGTAAETETKDGGTGEDQTFYVVEIICVMVCCCLVGAVCGWRVARLVSRWGIAVRDGLRRPLLPYSVHEAATQTDGRPVSLDELTVEAVRGRLQQHGRQLGESKIGGGRTKSEMILRLRALEPGWPFDV